MPSNHEFLTALFGDDLPWVHVTDFAYDPGAIPPGKHLKAWCGDYFSRYTFGENTNQYFTVSTFYADEKGKARRRKALFRATHVIVLDDVREKLSVDAASRLPPPSWVLETSPGSEQWGYILDQPCTDRPRVENLLDGLVANGLAPDGKDPGMKGVTRYVRLPGGVNTKASKAVFGKPPPCRMLEWHPERRTTLEALAAPFAVDLDRPRREGRVDGAAAVDDHPLLQIPDLVRIKEQRSDGRFDITCPWVDEHTGAADDGSAIFTNADGSIGFKCHHGACEGRTGRDLLRFIEEDQPGFGRALSAWQLQRSFAQVTGAPAPVVPPVPVTAPPPALPEPQPEDTLAAAFCMLRNEPPFSPQARDIAGRLLQAVDSLSPMERNHWQNEVREQMRWSKTEFREILRGLREEWYAAKSSTVNFFDEVVYVAELNQFYDRKKRIFYSPEAYQNAYAHLDAEARKQALQGGLVVKVDKLDYAPLMPPVFTEGGITFANSWTADHEVEGAPGDVSWYLQHFDHLGWTEYRKHVLQWMAFTIRHPDQKINHMLILGSGEGCGKDWLLYPLIKAMGSNSCTIAGEDLLGDFHDHLLTTKHLHVNETELGDRSEAMAISAKLKPLAAAPPFTLRVNQKGIKPIWIRNIVNGTMTTNSLMPIRLTGDSRRFFPIWSDMNPRDERGDMKPEWVRYWKERWDWMLGGGADHVIHYLRHHVDLSDFHPGVAPPVTDFLREIREASKSPALVAVETLIRERKGVFQYDLLLMDNIVGFLRMRDNPDVAHIDPRAFSPGRLAGILRDVRGVGVATMRDADGIERSVWVIREIESYRTLPPDEVQRKYDSQFQGVTQRGAGTPLMTVVK